MSAEPAEFRYVGVDGCKAGWFAVGFNERGDSYEFKVFTTFEELLDHYTAAKLILVDIPIGLPDGSGERSCDPYAREKLDKRKSSVFRVPTRKTLEEARYAEGDYWDRYKAANATECKVAGKGISPYTFGIMRAIAEVDEVMTTCDPSPIAKVRETHPELCFWALNSGCAMEYSKKASEGQTERLRVLKKVEKSENIRLRIQEIFEKASSKHVGKCVAEDDILDALAAAVTARLSEGQPCTVSETPQMDDVIKRPMEILYWMPETTKEQH